MGPPYDKKLERARALVQLEVYANQTLLVEEALKEEIFHWGDVDNPDPGSEIFEWWLVSRWLAGQLSQRGEAVLHELGCSWWGRSTTGAAVYTDGVIEDIVEKSW